jgi:hypothetical protein
MPEITQKKPLSRLAERIERVTDELKVRVHLAGLDAKDAWDRAHLERVGDELASLADEAKVQAHLAGLDAKDALSRVQDRLIELRGKLGVSADSIVHDLSQRLGELTHALRRSEVGDDDATEPRARS